MLSAFQAENPSNIATVEQTGTASRAYAVGEYLCYNGLLYRVTVAIAAGGAITPGTNCVGTMATDAWVSRIFSTYVGQQSTYTIDFSNYSGRLYLIATVPVTDADAGAIAFISKSNAGGILISFESLSNMCTADGASITLNSIPWYSNIHIFRLV